MMELHVGSAGWVGTVNINPEHIAAIFSGVVVEHGDGDSIAMEKKPAQSYFHVARSMRFQCQGLRYCF